MDYLGYTGHATYDSEDELLHGEVIGLKDVITFQSPTKDEVEVAFQESVHDYLEWCQELNEPPEKP